MLVTRTRRCLLTCAAPASAYRRRRLWRGRTPRPLRAMLLTGGPTAWARMWLQAPRGYGAPPPSWFLWRLGPWPVLVGLRRGLRLRVPSPFVGRRRVRRRCPRCARTLLRGWRTRSRMTMGCAWIVIRHIGRNTLCIPLGHEHHVTRRRAGAPAVDSHHGLVADLGATRPVRHGELHVRLAEHGPQV